MKEENLAQFDLWGNEIIENPLLRKRFIEPPFSVLDTKQGGWQARKRQWNDLGMQSEVGRDVKVIANSFGMEKYGRNKTFNETSIFDPSLCEVLYHWFCPDGGRILDPFCGGSVRGIVANYLGYKYTGIDIRQEQIDSNRSQSDDILAINNQPNYYVGDANKVLDDFIKEPVLNNKVKISAKSLLQKFQPCEPNYINNVCKGRCCQGSSGLMVTIHDSEKEKFSNMGIKIEDNFIKNENGSEICPFKKDGLCSIHENKPFGCKVSPFTLNKNNTLIVRNRYRMLKCYNTPDAKPAYISHRWSLNQIFGEREAESIINKIQRGDEEIYAHIPQDKYKIIVDNDISKHPERNATHEKFDFLFSCPPYADLEVYSDLPGDISNMNYENFLKAYEDIILKSCKLLKSGGLACFVVGEIRDKKGNMVGFVPDTIRAFEKAGLKLYNEAILLNTYGTAMLRANNTFVNGNKKLVKVHQNILVFKKD